ncbi:hypothetical protein [Nocardia sp. XZ_19_385]|uniref:hypothetical protein n=1 Tax=Nocardia sp. XZ_19_385 TaxID=2769488 RepID=UPI00188F2C37|nr:hypothetical protein [Nocardia sp. XZ_19_385]
MSDTETGTTDEAVSLAKDSAPEATEAPKEPVAELKTPEPRVSARTRAIALRAAAGVAIGAAVATSVYFFLQDRQGDKLIQAREDAQAAACKYAPILSDYDAKNLDTYFAAVLDGATGDWKKQFGDTSKELKEVLSQGQVVSKTTDVQCAIKTGDENSAEAIVVIGQTITSLGTQGKPAPGQLSMVMRLEKADGKWLVNKVNSPLAPGQQQ